MEHLAASHGSPREAGEGWASYLPPFPPVARKLVALSGVEQADFKEIADLLATDASLAAQVLRLANSALFGFQREISSILHALTVLGLPRITTLVLTSVLSRCLPVEPGCLDLVRICWRHNLACALLCEQLAPPRSREEARFYTAGLLHAIGQLALIAMHPAHYLDVLDYAEAEHLSIVESERTLLGHDHCRIGAQLLAEWGLPQDLVQAARCYADAAPGAPELPSVVRASCVRANQLGFDDGGGPGMQEVSPGLWAETRLEEIAEKINSIECSLLYA